MENRKRRLAVIDGVHYGPEDHGILTCDIGIQVVDGFHQGFGGLCLDDKSGKAFKDDLCALFKVPTIDALKGVRCYALWCFGHWNDRIEGLENMDGERFTLTGFVKRHWPENAKDRLSSDRESLVNRIASLQRSVNDAVAELARLDAAYTDWETAPKWHLK